MVLLAFIDFVKAKGYINMFSWPSPIFHWNKADEVAIISTKPSMQVLLVSAWL